MSRAGGYWDRFVNGDDSFHNLINVLDFPLESVEEDKGITENSDPQFQRPGLFNSDVSQGLPPLFNSDIAEHDNYVQVTFFFFLIFLLFYKTFAINIFGPTLSFIYQVRVIDGIILLYKIVLFEKLL